MNWLNILYAVVIAMIGPAFMLWLNKRQAKKERKDGDIAKINERLDTMESGISEIKESIRMVHAQMDEDKAVMTRQYVIDSAEDLTNNPDKLHTREWWDKGLRQCQIYEDYVRQHPEFRNYVAVYSISLFREMWEDATRNNRYAYRHIQGGQL